MTNQAGSIMVSDFSGNIILPKAHLVLVWYCLSLWQIITRVATATLMQKHSYATYVRAGYQIQSVSCRTMYDKRILRQI